MKITRTLISFLILVFALPIVGFSQISMTSTGSTTQDFNTLSNNTVATTWTDNSTIASWYSQRTGSGTTYQSGSGTSTTGNMYSFCLNTSATDKAIGSVGSGNATAGSFAHGVLLRNTSGAVLTNLTVAYTGEQWRRENVAAQTITFWYKTSSSPITSLNPNSNSTWTAVTALNFTSPQFSATASALDGNLAANRTVISAVAIPSLSLANNDYIMLKWDDPDHTGSDHGLGIDDVTVSWTTCVTPTLSGASQAATVCAGSGATINLTGLVNSSTGNAIDYTINGVAQTQITGVTASGTGTASFTSAALSAANNGQTLQITKITNGSCNTTFTTNVTLSVSPTTVGGTVGTSTSVCSGTNSTTLTLTGQTGSVVKWQYSTDNWVTPIDIANTTTSQTATNLTQTTKYRAVVQSGVCAATNATDAIVTVVSSATSIAPTTTQNLSVSVSGSTLTVTEGSTPSSRQWYYGTSTGGPYSSAISGETNSNYTPNFGSAGSYYVVCKSTYGSPCSATVTSNEVLINVTANTISTSAISGSPFCSGASVSVPFTYSPAGNFPSGGSCTFTAELSNASGSFASPTAIGTVVSSASGSQTISATIPGGTTTGTGYRIRVTSNTPAVTGSDNGINLTINTTVTPSVSIVSSPAAVSGITTICAGTSVTFTATPTNGGASPTYQWKVNGVNAGSGGTTFTTTTLTNGQTVTCDMTSNATCPSTATVTSNTITMTVNALVTPAVSIVSSPAAVSGVTTICSGTTVTFTPTPTNGGASPTYNWWKNGVGTGTNLGTSATYISPTLADADAIACVMTSNATCPSPTTATSNTITITNNTPATPTYTASSSAVAPGQTGVVYTVTSVAGVSYTWGYSGTGATITGTGNSVTVDFSTIATSGNISVVASKSGCLSSPASVAVTVTASAASDIQFNSGSSASSNTNIDYTLYQGTTLTNTGTGASGSIGVMGFTVRDGAGTTDVDALGTDLSAITFSVTNSSNIRNARIFNGSSPVGSVVSVSGGNLTFTGLTGLTTTDGGTLALNLRVTFNSTVTDNQKMVFTVASASTGSSSSTFAAGNAGGAFSDNNAGNDINRIEVTATKLAFGTSPSNASNGSAMSPSVTVLGQDANNNTDLDFNAAVTIACSTPSALTAGAGPVTASGGTATFSGIVHSTDGTYTMTASASGYSSTPSSSSYTISSVPANSYRTTSNGTWLTTGSTATWEQFVSGSWTSATRPAVNTSNQIYIRHAISGTSTTPANLQIDSGGTFTVVSSLTVATKLLVKRKGTLQVNASLTVSGIFEVEDSATVNLNFSFGTPSSSIWAGTEIFRPQSILNINNWDFANDFLIPDNTSISTNTYNGYTACFGHINIDAGSNSTTWIMIAGGTSINLAHGNLSFLSNSGTVSLATTGTITTGIGGDFYVDDLYTGTNVIQLKTSGTLNFTVKGNVQIDAATVRVHSGSAAGASTVWNIDGDLNITPSGVVEFNPTVSANATSTINLKGDLTGTGSGLLQNSNSSALGNFNFVGTGNGLTAATTQTIDIASTSSNENRYINFNINSGAYVRLINRDFELGTNSGVYVQGGGVFDFGFNGSTPLNVAISGSQTGSVFQSLQGSTLKITSPDGISTTGNTNNVRTVASNRSFNNTATFHYIGQTNQVTGNAITTGSTGKIIIAELASNSITLTPSNNIAMSNGTTLDALGGRLDIRKGIVVETPSATITGSGRLVMTDGVFQTSILSTTLPQLSNYSNYSLTGGTVELKGNGAQTISGAPTGGYYKVAITNAGTKSVTSAFAISKNLTITNGIFDPVENNITGNAGLSMTGGTFRMSAKGVTLPQLLGIDSVYSISGGTVELYGTSSSQTHSLRGTYNGTPGTNVNYYNVEINSTGANVGAGGANVVAQAGFGVAGTMNVNSPACFQLGSGFTITDAGTSTFEVKPGATFKYGGSIAASGASGNVRTDTRTFPTTASYGFVGNVSPQDPGTGLPSSMVNMYMDKTNAGDLVTITQDEEMTNSLAFYKGILKTNANTMYVSNTSTTAITGGNTSGTDKYVQGRLKRKTDGASTYTFTIGHSTQNAQGFTITPTGTSGSDLLGYLETNSTTPVKSVAYCDLETKTAAGQQIGQGSAGADGALDQIVFNLASPLQWDITNPGGGVTSYDVTVLGNAGQDISPVTSAGGTAIRYLLKNGEPGNTGFATGSGGADYPTVGFIACPNQYTLTGMTSFSKFTLNGANPSGTGLPVKLLFFTGKKVENYSQLDWATALEIDNEKFVVERSADAVHFESIVAVKGAGNTTVQQNYQWLDKSPLDGWNYYRLKQVDFDGDVEYTNTVAVNFDGDETTPSIIVFPSPSKDFINVQILGSNQIVEAVLYNMIGQAVKNVTPNERMSIEDLPSGEYFIKVIMGNNVVVKQFVKE